MDILPQMIKIHYGGNAYACGEAKFMIKLIQYFQDEKDIVQILENALLKNNLIYAFPEDMKIVIDYVDTKPESSILFIEKCVYNMHRICDPHNCTELTKYIRTNCPQTYINFLTFLLEKKNYLDNFAETIYDANHILDIETTFIDLYEEQTKNIDERPVITNYADLCRNYLEYEGELFQKCILKTNYNELIQCFNNNFHIYAELDNNSCELYSNSVIVNKLTNEDINYAESFALDYLKKCPIYIQNIIYIIRLIRILTTTGQLNFRYNFDEYIITIDICKFLRIGYIKIGYDAIADPDSLFSYFATICNNYTNNYDTTKKLCNIVQEYSGIFDSNKLNYINRHVIEPNSYVYNFFINMNNQYIFSVDEIQNFYNELNKMSVYHRFNKYIHVDLESFYGRDLSNLPSFIFEIYFDHIDKLL